MCGFRPSASTLATWLSAYYFSAAYCREELHQERSFLTLFLRADGVNARSTLSTKRSWAKIQARQKIVQARQKITLLSTMCCA